MTPLDLPGSPQLKSGILVGASRVRGNNRLPTSDTSCTTCQWTRNQATCGAVLQPVKRAAIQRTLQDSTACNYSSVEIFPDCIFSLPHLLKDPMKGDSFLFPSDVLPAQLMTRHRFVCITVRTVLIKQFWTMWMKMDT